MEQRDRHYQLSGIVEMNDYYVGVPPITESAVGEQTRSRL
jgi:hypothetical protein